MAIFSQRDEQTRVDFRNFNKSKPNRNIPFLLPKQLKEKLTKFMKTLNLNTGSIDMIYSTKKEFVFLEVNPVGQVGWLSENCNYYIERDIAYYLSN
jgi:glutathione synthase/RimK-type ligase-like ATP-grasp enzyme